MRFQIFFLILFPMFFLQPTSSQATHIIGGDISWKCLNNGKYIFYLNTYRECTGTTQYFNNITISYPAGSILMKPDSNKWQSYGAGSISHVGPTGCRRSCDNPIESGSIQFFPYKSDQIILNGVPPPGGWTFTVSICCRNANIVNLIQPTSSSYTLRAKMYPYQSRNTNNCFDSSPQFAELPAPLVCMDQDIIYNPSVIDEDLDSLVYSWAEPWDNPNVPVVFAPTYSYDSPMPDTSSHPQNKKAVLNSQTGEITFNTQSGQAGQNYTTTIRVDSYRKGKLISSIFRDIPFILFNCPDLPGAPFKNNPPLAMINGVPASNYLLTAYAGQNIVVPFQSFENDIDFEDTSDIGPNFQQNYLAPNGLLFSNDFINSSNCKDMDFAPCATLTPAPVLNPVNAEMELSNQGTLVTLFEWQTDCNHLFADSTEMSNGRTFNFVMKNYDGVCDVPGIIYPSISILLKRYRPTISVNGNVLSIENSESHQWYFNGNPIPNSDTNKITMQGNGLYSVEVVKYGCPSSITHYKLATSVDEFNLNSAKIYPNPFKDAFVVELPNLQSDQLRFQLFDMNGREVESTVHNEQEKYYIDTGQQVVNGVYFLEISINNRQSVKKMVKL